MPAASPAPNNGKIAALILASGASKRMNGRDKLCMRAYDRPLLSQIYHEAKQAQRIDRVFVLLPENAHTARRKLIDDPADRLDNPDFANGIGASLAFGIKALGHEWDAILILLADMPEIRAHHIDSLISARAQNPHALIWQATSLSGQPGHPVLFDRQCFGELAMLTGDQGAKSVLNAHRNHLHRVPMNDEAPVIDLDHEEDWARSRERHQS